VPLICRLSQPGQAELGIEIGDRDADVGGGGGEIAFGGAYVGTAAEQIGRQTGRHDRRGGEGDARLRQLKDHRIRGACEQDRERMHLAFALGHDRPDRGLRLRQLCALADRVAFGNETNLCGLAHDLQVARLARDLGAGDGLARLRLADLEIIVDHLGDEADLRVARVPDRRFGARGRTLDLATGAPENVELPAGIEAERVGRDETAGQRDTARTLTAIARPTLAAAGLAAAAEGAGERGKARILAEPLALHLRIGIDLRKQAGSCDTLLCARFGDTRGCRLDVEPVGERDVHQAIELRIVIDVPPSIKADGGHGRLAGRDFAELRGRRRFGGAVIGADRAAAEDQHEGEGKALHPCAPALLPWRTNRPSGVMIRTKIMKTWKTSL
jgi:hypothetical protein